MAEQPRINNLPGDAFGKHVDEYAPGLLNEDQWSARSDVWHHGGDQPVWDRFNTDHVDPLFHVGTEAAADERGGSYRFKFRVPQDRVADDRIGDADANILHAEHNINVGAPVSDSVAEYDPEDSDITTGRFNERMNDLHMGRAVPYENAVEDKGSTSMVVPQRTARLWSEDVIDQRNNSWEDPDTHEEPSPGLQDKAEYIGPSGLDQRDDRPHWGSSQPVLQDADAGFTRYGWNDTGRNLSRKAIVGKKPLASETRGGSMVQTPAYEGSLYEVSKLKEQDSDRLSQTMRGLLG